MGIGFDTAQFIGIGLALGLGLLVGIQRGWALRDMAEGTRFAGIRTFGLLGLTGGIAGILYEPAPGPALIVLAASAGLVLLGYRRASREGNRVSGTTGMVALITIASGFIAAEGERLLGSTIVVAMVVLLSLRGRLHRLVNSLSEQEIMAIARFAVIALVILPLLPDRGYGPYSAWNPRQLWGVVVLVSGFSFAGYFGAKLLGPARGILAAAAAGSMVSSTAVTASVATRMKQGDNEPALLAAAISIASLVMFIRVLLLVTILAPFALAPFAKLVAAGMIVSFAASAWFLRQAPRGAPHPRHDLPVRNPFDLGPAILLTALVMVFTLVAHWVLAQYGDRGLAAVLAISGTIDVDSAIITMGGLPKGTLTPEVAGAVLAVPVTLNTLFKASISVSIARRKGWNGTWPLVLAALAVVLSWLLFG